MKSNDSSRVEKPASCFDKTKISNFLSHQNDTKSVTEHLVPFLDEDPPSKNAKKTGFQFPDAPWDWNIYLHLPLKKQPYR